MALIIQPTQDKKIYIQGTSIELPQVYNRLEFGCRPNGITMEIAFYTSVDYASYRSGSFVLTTVPTNNITRNIDPLTQVQDVYSAHSLAKTWYEEQGYEVTIDLD